MAKEKNYFLIVDNCPEGHQAFEMALSNYNFKQEFVLANSSEEAYSILKTRSGCELLLTSQMKPVHKGVSHYQLLLENPELANEQFRLSEATFFGGCDLILTTIREGISPKNILLVSGFSESDLLIEDIEKRLSSESMFKFLQKPYNFESFTKALTDFCLI